MNIRNSYTIFAGLTGKNLLKLPVKIILLVVYAITLLYVALFEIFWLGGTIPVEILFGGYRSTPTESYANIVAFLFIIMYLHQLHFIRCYAERIFNETTNQYLFFSTVSGLKFYISYFIWRSVSLLKINLLYITPLILLYLLKDGAFVYTYLINIYIIFASSLIIAVIFDLFFYFSKRAQVSEFITLFTILCVSLLTFILQTPIQDFNLDPIFTHFLHALPDVISTPYQYVLKSLSAIYSHSKLYYPLISLCILLSGSVLLNRNLISRLAKSG